MTSWLSFNARGGGGGGGGEQEPNMAPPLNDDTALYILFLYW